MKVLIVLLLISFAMSLHIYPTKYQVKHKNSNNQTDGGNHPYNPYNSYNNTGNETSGNHTGNETNGGNYPYNPYNPYNSYNNTGNETSGNHTGNETNGGNYPYNPYNPYNSYNNTGNQTNGNHTGNETNGGNYPYNPYNNTGNQTDGNHTNNNSKKSKNQGNLQELAALKLQNYMLSDKDILKESIIGKYSAESKRKILKWMMQDDLMLLSLAEQMEDKQDEGFISSLSLASKKKFAKAILQAIEKNQIDFLNFQKQKKQNAVPDKIIEDVIIQLLKDKEFVKDILSNINWDKLKTKQAQKKFQNFPELKNLNLQNLTDQDKKKIFIIGIKSQGFNHKAISLTSINKSIN